MRTKMRNTLDVGQRVVKYHPLNSRIVDIPRRGTPSPFSHIHVHITFRASIHRRYI
jgi:hypothetical protein